MQKLTLFLSFLVLAQSASSQEVKQFVLNNTQQVRSNSITDDNFDDLEVIGKAIGNADLVLLGEQDHGDAPAFKAKARLIKYLHEQKGFDVIAFESDFYGLQSGSDAMKEEVGAAAKLMKENIFSLWTKCVECDDVFNYIDTNNTAGRLKVTGFDSQLHGKRKNTSYKNDIQGMLTKVNSKWTDSLSPLLNDVARYYPLHTVKEITADRLMGYSRLLDSTILELSSQPDSSYIKILVKSLKAYVSQQFYFLQKSQRYMTVRDKQMAENLLWLRKYRFPGQKIIVWAHNYHIAKNSMAAFTPKYGQHISMGNELGPLLKDSLYVLGFTSYGGKAGRISVKPFKVGKPKKESIEEWMSKGNPAFSFVDLKTFRDNHPQTKESFFMKGKMHENAEAVWTDVFDGVFYIRDMYPCSREKE